MILPIRGRRSEEIWAQHARNNISCTLMGAHLRVAVFRRTETNLGVGEWWMGWDGMGSDLEAAVVLTGWLGRDGIRYGSVTNEREWWRFRGAPPP